MYSTGNVCTLIENGIYGLHAVCTVGSYYFLTALSGSSLQWKHIETIVRLLSTEFLQISCMKIELQLVNCSSVVVSTQSRMSRTAGCLASFLDNKVNQIFNVTECEILMLVTTGSSETATTDNFRHTQNCWQRQ
jgi:hypothetical protein